MGSALAGVIALQSTSAAQTARMVTHPADAWLDELKGQHKNIYESQKVLENGAPATQNAFAKAANDLSARGVIVAGVIVTNRAQEKGFAYTYVG